MSTNEDRVGVVFYTHDHVDDARISFELVRGVWRLPGPEPYIVHAINGPEEIYPEAHLEDQVVRRRNLGHFAGAADLIDAGAAAIAAQQDVRYAVFLASDTWILDSTYLAELLAEMRRRQFRLAAVPWGYPEWSDPFENGLSVDFFIIDMNWARQFDMFPFDYVAFEERFGEAILYFGAANVSVERLLVTRFLQASFRETPDNVNRHRVMMEKVRLMVEREPVHHSMNDPERPGQRRGEWPELALYTQDGVGEKRRAMRQVGVPPAGPTIKRLLESTDLDWFNDVAARP